MEDRPKSIRSIVIGGLSLLSSLITIGGMLWHFMPSTSNHDPLASLSTPYHEAQTMTATVSEPPQPEHKDASLSESDPEKQKSRAVAPTSGRSLSYRFRQNESLTLLECQAQVGVQFRSMHDTDYAVLTIAPRLGKTFNQAIMGPGASTRFRCTQTTE